VRRRILGQEELLMRGQRISIGLRTTLVTFIVISLVTSTYAATEQVLYSFDTNGTDGSEPYAGLIFDASGDLYGTTFEGGAYGAGTVFELIKPATKGGNWTEQVLYSFGAYTDDGTYPHTNLIFDAVDK
jgi:uncharacterized repeat protein (TIGR03803 family)